MNEYIINPSWFYWMEVAGGFKTVFGIIAMLCGVGVIFCGVSFAISLDWDDKEEQKLQLKRTIGFSIAVIVAVILTVFIPSKETLIQMKLAELGTYDNANKAIEMIQDATDYILEHLRGGE